MALGATLLMVIGRGECNAIYLVKCKAFQLLAIELAWFSLPGENRADINATLLSVQSKN